MTKLQNGKNTRRSALRLAVLLAATALCGCASLSKIENNEDVSRGLSYQAQYRSDGVGKSASSQSSLAINAQKCTTGSGASVVSTSSCSGPVDTQLLSQGDLVTLLVEEDELLSGRYEIMQDGTLKIPHVAPVRASGRTVEQVERELAATLKSNGYYRSVPRVSIRLQDIADARVNVSGAVFEPGAVSVGGQSSQDRDLLRQEASGAGARDRRLSRALQVAGGVRPDADLARIKLNRGGATTIIDVRPALDGRPFNDVILLSGDVVEVPSRNCFQEELVKPSSITMQGVRVFMSNLADSASNNAGAAIGKETQDLRYGPRVLQAIAGMNCLGGSKLTNANRTAALISRNPVTGESIVVERSVERLMRQADRDDFNPYIMPGDAMACYDSNYTSVTDVLETLPTVLGPVATLSLL